MATLDVIPDVLTIQLTRGQVTIVDAVDSDLAEFRWRAAYHQQSNCFRAIRNIRRDDGKEISEFLHRVILARMLGRPLLRSELVDHIHHNTLDNRRSELRLATNGQNQHNQRLPVNNTSGYKGVTLCKKTGRWMAYLKFNSKRQHLGYFDTLEEAAHAYDEAALRLYGEFAVLNFPPKT